MPQRVHITYANNGTTTNTLVSVAAIPGAAWLSVQGFPGGLTHIIAYDTAGKVVGDHMYFGCARVLTDAAIPPVVTRDRPARTSRPALARMLRRGRRSGRWSPGPYSHLERLRRAAWGDHECFYFPVRITP